MARIRFEWLGFDQFQGLFQSSLEWIRRDLTPAFEAIGNYGVDLLSEESRIHPGRRFQNAAASGDLSSGFTSSTDLEGDGGIIMRVINSAQYEPVVRQGTLPRDAAQKQPPVVSYRLGGMDLLTWVQRKPGIRRHPGQTDAEAAYLIARAIGQGRSDSYKPSRIPNRYDLRVRDQLFQFGQGEIQRASQNFEIVAQGRDIVTGRFTRAGAPGSRTVRQRVSRRGAFFSRTFDRPVNIVNAPRPVFNPSRFFPIPRGR